MYAIGVIEGPQGATARWSSIDWSKVRRHVSRLQARIVKAVRAGRWHRVRCLQRLLANSLAAKLLAVQRVSSNRGQRTAGVDGIVLETPAQKWQQAQQLNAKDYTPKPLKRIYIPKKNGKRRPLGIPVQADRAEQALELLALDPVSETLADTCSYGFRQARSAQDAIAACFQALAQRTSAKWILEGDIRGCFDHLDHDWLVGHLPTDQGKLRAWLKAGYIERGMFHPTAAGTPQGGIISPAAANMALDGLATRLKAQIKGQQKVHLVRYADDFIITGVSRALLEERVKPLVVQFLKERGLELAEEKTRIVHIDQGFDFLGFNVRKYQGKLLIKPAASSIAAVKERVRGIIQPGKGLPQGVLIRRLNPVLRGWGNYYRHVVSKDIFNDIDHAIWRMTWNWAKRRHPQRVRRWVKERYYTRKEGYDWVFTDGSVDLFRMLSIPIRRHVRIRAASNPYDPAQASYFAARRACHRQEAAKSAPAWLFCDAPPSHPR
jgi:RNA-directed DNA polymerase